MRSRFALLASLMLPLSVFLVVPAGRAPIAPVARLAPAAAEDEDELVDKVRKSIADGVAFLKNKQSDQGHWEVFPAYRGGATGLALLALLQAGVPPTDPKVQKGLAYLRDVKAEHTYVVALQTMVYVNAGQPIDRLRINANVRWLLDLRTAKGWGYSRARTVADNSNSQYALLALHEAIRSGVSVPEKDLKEIQKLYLDTQLKVGDPEVRGGALGGWGYFPGSDKRVTVTMTTAGLCNLLITGLDLNVGKSRLRPDGSAEKCGEYDENNAVVRALAYLGQAFPSEITPTNAGKVFDTPFYALYGIERAGRLTGQRFFGGHDWYEVGCRFLVKGQKADGSWGGTAAGGRGLDGDPVIATSFSLLFLAKGRTPVLISKLAYGAPSYTGWNNKRNDMKHLVDFASRELFKRQPLAWQAFDVRDRDLRAKDRKAIVQELLQSPIVFFNGHDQAPRGELRAILKEYLANGGFVVAENCCGKAHFPNFDKDLRNLVESKEGLDADLETIEPEHPLWTASGKFASSPKDFPLKGVKQGCRTVLVYSPVPLAGYWEANLTEHKQGKKAFRMGANIIAYATGLEPPRPRLTRVTIAAEEKSPRLKRGFLKVGQLRYPSTSTWKPAPKAMSNLMAEARKAGLDVTLTKGDVFPSHERVHDHRFLYMHGRGDFKEDKDNVKELRFCLKNGGLLLADACCGAPTFDKAFRRFMKTLWADDKLKLEPIPPGDELYGAELNGEPIRTVRCRVLGPDGKPTPGYREIQPLLEGVKYKGRWIVVYSRYDVGCALERSKSPDCLGHDYDSAVRLGRAAVLYALKR